MIKVCVLTLSDRGSSGERDDHSGPVISEMIGAINGKVEQYEILPDEKELIVEKLIQYAGQVDVILTTGGTGLSPRDVTPEATLEVIEKEVPGMAEVMRSVGMQKTNRAMLSRAVAGVRGETLIINLPGSPKAVREGLEAIIDVLPHAVEKIKGGQEECAR